MGGTLIKTDLGHGRGWAAPAPAASIRRIDAQLGRLADINEAGRSPEQADENRRRWLAYERYLNGGPWAPKASYALGSDESVHCWGYAADTDDSYDPEASAVWLDNGWVQTALYPNNPRKHEPWHREYQWWRDNHRNDPAPAGGGTSKPASEPEEEDEEMKPFLIWKKNPNGTRQWALISGDLSRMVPIFKLATANALGKLYGAATEVVQNEWDGFVNASEIEVVLTNATEPVDA